MNPITLPRTGRAPLSFVGREVASVSSHKLHHHTHSRWHTITVYESPGDRHIVAVQYRTQWAGEPCHDSAMLAASPQLIADMLTRYDPCGFIVGYPPNDHYGEKQRRLLADVRTRYNEIVSQVLDELGIIEEVE